MTTTVGARQQAGRRDAEAVSERSHLETQPQDRESGVASPLETTKPATSDTVPPTRPHLPHPSQTISSQAVPLTSIQIYEPLGAGRGVTGATPPLKQMKASDPVETRTAFLWFV